jgi:hypothetical protein
VSAPSLKSPGITQWERFVQLVPLFLTSLLAKPSTFTGGIKNRKILFDFPLCLLLIFVRTRRQNINPVDRVLGFFSSRSHWDPNPSPAGECVPPPPLFGSGGGHTR